MTIQKGEPWGEAVARPTDLDIAGSDAALAVSIERDPGGDHAVTAGDLHRTLGSPTLGERRVLRLPIDVVHVETDRSRHLAVAHVVIRRRWWRGRVVVVSNVDHLGEWNVAPRAHPNDGRLDLLDVDPAMPLRARLQARRRLHAGLHVPHPQIDVRRITEWEWNDPAGAGVWVDGIAIGKRTWVSVSVEPDASAIYI